MPGEWVSSVSDPMEPRAPKLAIRPATGADVLSIAKVHNASWRETYPGLLPPAMLARLSISDEAIRRQRMLDRPRGPQAALAFVADQLGSVVGYGLCHEQRTALLHRSGFTGEVSELYVLRDAQRLGAGSGLVKAMARSLLDRGHGAMSLWVLEQNRPARCFYERIGGRLIAEKRANLVEVAYGWKDLQTLVLNAK